MVTINRYHNHLIFGGRLVKQFIDVKKAARYLNKSEETIRRYLRNGIFPNAIKKSDSRGWRIPIEELDLINESTSRNMSPRENTVNHLIDKDIRELVAMSYKAVTLTDPTEEMVGILSNVGIHRTLEVLLTMQLSPSKVKNPPAFIKKAISKGWKPETVPLRKEKNLSQIKSSEPSDRESSKLPFYNWLEE